MDINESQLAFELYKSSGCVDVFYYRAVTGNMSSNATIRSLLEDATEGFDRSDVTKEQFLRNYKFGKFPMVRDWVRYYAEQGLRLKVADLFVYMQEV